LLRFVYRAVAQQRSGNPRYIIIKTTVTDKELLFLYDISGYRRGVYYYVSIFWHVTPCSFVDISPTTKLHIPQYRGPYLYSFFVLGSVLVSQAVYPELS
jgi:hypothetical protein